LKVTLISGVSKLIKLQQTIGSAICAGVTSIALTSAIPAQAASFVSTFRPPGNTTDVGSIDPTTGAFNPFSTSSLQLTDIALNTTNQLFGVTYDQLYQLNPGTNNQQIVGNLGVTGMNGLAFDNNNNLYGIAGRSSSQNGAGDPGFYRINTATGAATLLNNLSSCAPGAFNCAPTAFSFVNGVSVGDTSDIVFDPNTNQFLAVSGNNNSILFSISLSGTATKIGDVGFGYVAGLAIEGGSLFGYTTDRRQIKIDRTTGIGIFDKNLTGTTLLIGGATSSTQVPEPSSAAGYVFLGVCLGTRLLTKRKQQKSVE
jgi:hypothetical protein